MKRLSVILAIACVIGSNWISHGSWMYSGALILTASAESASGNENGHDRWEDLSEQINDIFKEWDQKDGPGYAVAVTEGGEVKFLRTYGMANLEDGIPIEKDSVFDLASLAKQFTGFSIAMLSLEGKIDLDKDIRVYWPEAPDFGKTITVRHLLHHTSGLRDWPALFAFQGKSMSDVISYDAILELFKKQRDLNFEPGAQYLYSNTGYNVLAHLVERVGGQSFRDWTTERIFEPLGMTNTWFHNDNGEIVRKRVQAYDRRGDGVYGKQHNQLTAVGSSSLYSTIEDLTRWLINLDTGKAGGKEALELLRQRGKLNNGEQNSYALGVVVEEEFGELSQGHSGSWAGFRTTTLHFPGHELGIAILGNFPSAAPESKAWQIANLVLKRDKLSEEQAAEYAGDYQSPELDVIYTVRLDDGKLIADDGRQGKITLTPKGVDRFSGSHWFFSESTFKRDEKGEVTEMRVHNGRLKDLRFVRVK